MKNFQTDKEILSLFPIQSKPIELQYSGSKISTDGVLLLLKEVENRLASYSL